MSERTPEEIAKIIKRLRKILDSANFRPNYVWEKVEELVEEYEAAQKEKP